jgi:type IV pilus assembly protein PilW
VNINTMRVTSTLSLQANDLLLITDSGLPCMVQQVTSTADDQVNLGGDFSAAVINGQALNDRSLGTDYAQAFLLGNAGNNNPPRFFLLGVNSNQQLVRYDLLRFTNDGTNKDAAVPLADGVVDMRVLYGIDTDGNGIIDSWVSPRTSGYTASEVILDQKIARRIIAAKVSLVLRSQQVEDKLAEGTKADASNTTSRSSFEVAPATITMFPSMDKAMQSTYTVTDRQRRHTVLEFTVPMRNVISTLRSETPA